MEEEAPPRRSVADLAGQFKGSTPSQDAAGEKTEKPVRRRPPRSLQIPKPQEDHKEPAGVSSTLPAKAKRNSALIEKLQANLALSPTALLPSPKSPGFRLLSPSFPPHSPLFAPVTAPTAEPSTPTTVSPVAISPLTEEEGPASFEAPPTADEGSILSNINKSRARHSIRRRPPSRRHRKTSCEDEVDLSSPTEQEDKTTEGDKEAGGGGGGGGGGGQDEDKTGTVKEEKHDTPITNETHEEEKTEIKADSREEDTKDGEVTFTGGRAEASSSGTREEEEKSSEEKHEEESTKEATNTESREEEKSEEPKGQTPS